MTEPKPMILEGIDIEHAYGRVDVLEGVSLGVREHEVTALIGPNGSGKTTLVRALVGLHEPTAGTVRYHGPKTARPIGYLPQQPAFRSGATVRETLEFYASLVGESADRALSRLERVGLADASDRDASALSGGMTRLVGIAQATIGSPPVIVLDEPASGLDPRMSVHIFDVIADLAATGTAVLLTSHDLALVERTADRVALLDGGTLVRTGSPREVCEAHGVSSLLDVFDEALETETGTLRVAGEAT